MDYTKSLVRFDSASALLETIPANVLPLLALKSDSRKSKDGTRTTSKVGSFTLMTFAAFAESQGLTKPAKGTPKDSPDREAWKKAQRDYDRQKPDAAAFVKKCIGGALTDNKLTGVSIKVGESISKKGSVRRRVTAVLADPSAPKGSDKIAAARATLEAAGYSVQQLDLIEA